MKIADFTKTSSEMNAHAIGLDFFIDKPLSASIIFPDLAAIKDFSTSDYAEYHEYRVNYKDEEYFSETTETILSKYSEHIVSILLMMVYGRNGDADCRRPVGESK